MKPKSTFMAIQKSSFLTLLLLLFLTPITYASTADDACNYNCLDPGSVTGDQTISRGAIPGPLSESEAPSCEPGELEYLWMYFDQYSRGWKEVPNSNVKNYQPGQLFYTTYFLRCVRVKGCSAYIESNIIRVGVVDCIPSGIQVGETCLGKTVSVSAGKVNTYAEISYDWTFSGGASKSTASGLNVNVSWATVGMKTITLRVRTGKCDITYTRKVTVKDCDCADFACEVFRTSGCGSGSARASAINGKAPFTYKWSTGATTETVSGLSPGFYHVTVTDANGCVCTRTFPIYRPLDIDCRIWKNNPSGCGLSDGSATAQGIGGSGGYRYAWSNGASGRTITGLSAGTYRVTITDNGGGCKSICSVTLNDPGLTCEIGGQNAVCALQNGEASITPSGGSGNYAYSWSNGGATQTITGLSPGTYTGTVTDRVTGCQCSKEIILDADAPTFTIAVELELRNGATQQLAALDVDPGCCNYSAQATIMDDPDCGDGYDIVWSNGQTGPIATGLCAGATITATATSKCTGCVQTSGALTLPTDISCDITINASPTCDDPDAGMLTVNPAGGEGDYTYCWTQVHAGCNGEVIPTVAQGLQPICISITNTASGLVAGKYMVVVRDEFGCEAMCMKEICGPDDCCDLDPKACDETPKCNGEGMLIKQVFNPQTCACEDEEVEQAPCEDGYVRDADCNCVCGLTETDCAALGQALDLANCECVAIDACEGPPPACGPCQVLNDQCQCEDKPAVCTIDGQGYACCEDVPSYHLQGGSDKWWVCHFSNSGDYKKPSSVSCSTLENGQSQHCQDPDDRIPVWVGPVDLTIATNDQKADIDNWDCDVYNDPARLFDTPSPEDVAKAQKFIEEAAQRQQQRQLEQQAGYPWISTRKDAGYTSAIYPNPFNESINVIVDEPSAKSLVIEVLNISGQIIRRIEVDGGYSQQSILLDDQPSGIYLIRVRGENVVPEVHKVVKR